MRELDFLPAWYPKLRQRRRTLALQAYLTIALAAALGIGMTLMHRSLHAARASDAALFEQIASTRRQLGDMDRLALLRNQLQAQDRVLSSLGAHVDAARMIRAIDQALPREMALTGLQMTVEETAAPHAGTTQPSAQQPMHRWLRVTFQGVAPAAANVDRLKTQLAAMPYFEHVAVTSGKEHGETGRALREFEATFAVNLNVQQP